MGVEFVTQDSVVDLASEARGRIVIEGPRNVLRVGRNVTLDIDIFIQGSGCLVEIEDDCRLAGVIHIVRGEGAVVRIGQTTTFNGVALTLHEAGEIVIGRDCLFATEVQMDVSDMHPIYDGFSLRRLNPARGIHIGDHVWIGRRAFVLKGAQIGSGGVIGAGSMVAGTLPANVVAFGSPARIVRRNVVWSRNFEDEVMPLARPLGASSLLGRAVSRGLRLVRAMAGLRLRTADRR